MSIDWKQIISKYNIETDQITIFNKIIKAWSVLPTDRLIHNASVHHHSITKTGTVNVIYADNNYKETVVVSVFSFASFTLGSGNRQIGWFKQTRRIHTEHLKRASPNNPPVVICDLHPQSASRSSTSQLYYREVFREEKAKRAGKES